MANQHLEKNPDPDLPPYSPSSEQWQVHLCGNEQTLVAGGEAAGKSRMGAQEMLGRIKPGGRYWFAGQQYEATHVEFMYTLSLLKAIGAVTRKDQVRMPIKEAWSIKPGPPFEGAEISTRTVEDFTKIRAWTLDGALLCEAALCSFEAYKRLEARSVHRRKNAWLLLTGTFEKSEGPWFAKLYNQWQIEGATGESFSVPTWSNTVLYPGGENDDKILELRENMDEDRFMERHAGKPVPPSTLVFPRFDIDTHIGDYAFRAKTEKDDLGDRDTWPVELAIDPGYANYAILAVQRGYTHHGVPCVYVIDEVWGHRKTTEDLLQECKKRRWWRNVRKGYAGVIDVASKQHHGDRSVREVWRASGYMLRSRHVKIEAGIDRVASFLQDASLKNAVDKNQKQRWTEKEDWARLFIDKRCSQLIEEFTEYRYAEGPDTARRIPIDAYNHGIKALGYYLIDRYGHVHRRPTRSVGFKMVV